MASTKNKHGLQREIESPKKRAIRQRDGFGCIICSFPIIEYEHVDPLFKDAEEHSIDAITLLCPNCHRKVTNGWISKELVKEAMQNAKAVENQKVSDTLFFTKSHPTIKMGGGTFERCKVILRLKGEDIFAISEEDGRYFINAKFWDSKGKQTLTIVDNEWQAQIDDLWDLELEGNRITIREKHKKPSLIFSLTNNNLLTIEKIEMKVKGVTLSGNANALYVNYQLFQQFDMVDCGICFLFE